ncbi:MAG: hypothetical protein FWH57_11535 [Oscillospiraceae bacterium]|nr:hypothetical protein [Oscillospiraceae bacterium]
MADTQAYTYGVGENDRRFNDPRVVIRSGIISTQQLPTTIYRIWVIGQGGGRLSKSQCADITTLSCPCAPALFFFNNLFSLRF